ncbi:hypothetical protein WR25_02247 [Diploscapter pachys]|uniref:Uncharacterized protein n=1 Tax=Diploscapter pachys TaxID=2018661 RepID=A0A2A2LET4_9BILA|nr:hypothetical protein WR25_02247 [Diploscapter pachys]
MTDERSAPFFPNLYIAGDKAGEKPFAVPDVHLPGQMAQFTGRSAFNPFTHAVAAVYNEDLVDSWGTGFAVNMECISPLLLRVPSALNTIYRKFVKYLGTLTYLYQDLMNCSTSMEEFCSKVPNVNLFLVPKNKMMERLQNNRLNPTMIG